MQWFYDLKIGVKLISSFILIALVAGVVGYIGITEIKSTSHNYTELFNLFGKPLTNIGIAGKAFHKSRGLVKDIILDRGSNNREQYVAKINELDRLVASNLEEFEKSISTEQERILYHNLDSVMADYKVVREKVVRLALENQEDKALLVMRQQGQQIAQSIDNLIEELLKQKVSIGEKKAAEYAVAVNHAVTTMVVVIVIGMTLALMLGLFISRNISNPVGKLLQAANKLSVGDIKVNVQSSTKDEIGILMESFAKMVENIREQANVAERIAAGDLTVQVRVKSEDDVLGKNLKKMVEQNNEVLNGINSASEQVAAGAKQVSASSQGLSQGSTEQAASIEEVTASIEQIATQTKQNAVNANQANELALAAKVNALQGNEQMKEMLGAMGEINDSSANISKIIKVIDEIAFQTNILALNAAVEAARAGQHGKGFAVVAEEVRNLAARSANAAKETTAMIEGSIKKVELGTRIANETAQALDKIVEGITKATALVGEIATASNEQASAITQVNQAIMQVSQVTQMNTATAEESAAASEELSAQALLLKDAVGKFKLRKLGRESTSYANLSPEALKMIEEMLKKKDALGSNRESVKQAASTVQKSKIVLDDKEFGKY